MPIRLTARLQMIADIIPHCTCAADIGCDHGRLAVYILQRNIADRVIAADISRHSVIKTTKLVNKCRLENRCDIRLGDGLKVLHENEAQAVIISGIGGPEIINILSDAQVKLDYYIIQAQNLTEKLRLWLSENNYEITDERLCREDNRYYEIILAKRGSQTLTDAQCEFGPVILERKDPILYDYLLKKRRIVIDCISKLENFHTVKACRDRETILSKLSMYNEVESWLKSKI